jgi:RNA-directed DNA polymerase
MIPKADGRERPLGIASLEDKVVQRAMVEILNEIYEADFLGFSYGFRPGRGQHDALDALAYAITRTPVNWVIDADLQAYLDRSSQCPLVYDGWSNRPGSSLRTLMRKPFRLPS